MCFNSQDIDRADHRCCTGMMNRAAAEPHRLAAKCASMAQKVSTNTLRATCKPSCSGSCENPSLQPQRQPAEPHAQKKRVVSRQSTRKVGAALRWRLSLMEKGHPKFLDSLLRYAVATRKWASCSQAFWGC